MIEDTYFGGLSLNKKLIFAFLAVAILVGVTGAAGFVSVSSVGDDSQQVSEQSETVDITKELVIAIEREQTAINSGLADNIGAEDEFNTETERFNRSVQRMQTQNLGPEEQALFQNLTALHDQYVAVSTDVLEAKQAGDLQRANQLTEEQLIPLVVEMRGTAYRLEGIAEEKKQQAVSEAASTTSLTQLTMVGFTIGSFVIAIGIGLFISKWIKEPIVQLSESASRISEGDLDVEIDEYGADDELGQMVDAFGVMQTNLRGVVTDLNTISQNLKTGQLEQEIDTDYPGVYGDIVTDLDEGIVQLTASFEEIQRASENLKQGELDQEIDTDLPGQYGAALTDLTDGTAQMQESFDQISRASERLKQGQLNQTLDTDAPGAYGTILSNLDHGIDQLGESVRAIQQIAGEVTDSSNTVSTTADGIETASQEVADSVDDISRSAMNQRNQLQEVVEEMDGLSTTVEEIAASTEELSATATTAAKRGETGRSTVSGATDEMGSIETETEDVTAQVRTLEQQIDEIDEIVGLITEIAEQTNLLALNASIEAARAGEAGDGFAVVADEIKSLSEEVSEATTEIEAKINTVQTTTDDTVESIESMRDRVSQGAETIEEAMDIFDDIADVVTEAESGIREISDATDSQAASAEEVVAMITEVHELSEQTTVKANSVSDAAEKQAQSASEATDNTQQLAEFAAQLDKQISQFEVH